jgi:hypothetical protein
LDSFKFSKFTPAGSIKKIGAPRFNFAVKAAGLEAEKHRFSLRAARKQNVDYQNRAGAATAGENGEVRDKLSQKFSAAFLAPRRLDEKRDFTPRRSRGAKVN